MCHFNIIIYIKKLLITRVKSILYVTYVSKGQLKNNSIPLIFCKIFILVYRLIRHNNCEGKVMNIYMLK